MSLNCLIAYCIASINVSVKHKVLVNRCPYSKYVVEVLAKLQKKGIIKSYKVIDTHLPYKVEFHMLFINDSFLISKIRIISTPSAHVHMSYLDMKKYLDKYDNILVSTDRGLFDYKECVALKLGGKVVLGYK